MKIKRWNVNIFRKINFINYISYIGYLHFFFSENEQIKMIFNVVYQNIKI